jgi:PSP
VYLKDGCKTSTLAAAGIKPGVVSEELQAALGMASGDPPPWLGRMAALGLPPGYMLPAEGGGSDEVDYVDITVFAEEAVGKVSTADAPVVLQPSHGAPLGEEEDMQLCSSSGAAALVGSCSAVAAGDNEEESMQLCGSGDELTPEEGEVVGEHLAVVADRPLVNVEAVIESVRGEGTIQGRRNVARGESVVVEATQKSTEEERRPRVCSVLFEGDKCCWYLLLACPTSCCTHSTTCAASPATCAVCVRACVCRYTR